LIRHKRREDEQNSLFEVLDEALEPLSEEAAEEVKMTGAQALEAKGRREGRIEERREILLEQLEEKFGPLSEAVVAAVNTLEPGRAKALIRRIVTARTLEEFNL
jgi:hypothetical protein